MVNKCSIRKNPNSAPTEAELKGFIKGTIKKLDAIYDNEDYYTGGVLNPTKMKLATIDLLQSLGRDYVVEDHKYIAEAIEATLKKPSYRILRQIIPDGYILDLMQAEGTADKASKAIFTDRIEDDIDNQYDSVNYFINNAYGQAVAARMQLERKMANIVLGSFVIDRKSGKIIGNIGDALTRVEMYKKQLLEDIQDYFIVEKIKSPFTTTDLKTRSVKDIIEMFKKDISQRLQVGIMRPSEIQSLYDIVYNSNSSPSVKRKAMAKLEAYGSWLALQHFDNFIKMVVGDTIKINPMSSDRYSYSEKGTNINTTWRKDDNIDVQAEVNKLTQALITTSPMIQFGSLTPISGSYLQFSDFSYITAKIKDLVYDPKVAKMFPSSDASIMKKLSESEQRLVKNKSLRQLISNSRYNPQVYLPLIYKILTIKKDKGGYVIDSYGKFNIQDKNLVWSIYKNIYDPDFNGMGANGTFHSLYSIQQANADSKNYYAAVSSTADCIFSVDFVQYVQEDGVLKMRTLRDAAVAKTRREIENIINTKNSTELVGNFDFKPYQVTILDAEGNKTDDASKIKGISFRLTLSPKQGNPDYLYVHITDMGETIKLSRSENPSGIELNPDEIKSLESESAVVEFFDEMLGLNLASDAEFRNTYKELTKEANDNVTPYINSIMALSSHVFFNRYFAQNYLNTAKYKNDKTRLIAKYFKDEESRPRFNGAFFNMEMTPRKKYGTILTLAQALGSTRGLNSSRQVKDSDNAMLSSQTLSRLLGNMVQQLDIQIGTYNKIRELQREIQLLDNELNAPIKPNAARKKQIENTKLRLLTEISQLRESTYTLDTLQNPAAGHFDLITNPELFKGISKAEEIKGLYGNKKQVKFTTSEAVISSFLHNFVLGHCTSGLEPNSELGNGVVGLLPSVNSDKTTVGIAKFDLNARVKGSDRTYMSLSNPELITLICHEIGKYYKTMYDNIKDDFNQLTTWAVANNKLPVLINPDDNFKALNDWVENNNADPTKDPTTASKKLFELVNDYNKANPTKPIRLIDQIHYISEKGTGRVVFNNTIRALVRRFSDERYAKEFFALKSSEVLKSALDAGFTINLYGNKNLDKQPEVAYLREHYGDWINLSGQMVLARVKVGNNVMDVASKNDLLKVEQALGITNLIGNIHKIKDIMTLHPMLERYNLMDYLFTQQLMSSTVGSHVAHPAKGTIKTPIIWAHPAIGKSYVVDKGTYAHRFMDWDVEFNHRRDAWIANHSGTVVGTDAFKKQRSYYQMNWKNIPEYQEFVKQEWKRIKAKANSENKILVASPHILLEMFSDEFNSVLTMSHDAFVERSMARGDSDPEGWKTDLDVTINTLSANPIFARKVKMIGDNDYLTTLVENGSLQSELDLLLDNEMAEEASRFYAQHKRNVSFTASMMQFQLNQVEGIPLWYNIAIIDDIKEDLFTIDGQTNSAKPYDGATFVNPFIVYLENNSLNEARAGIDKKQFVHYYDELTGTGGIIKTAGFAVTNDRMRNSLFYRDMMRNMTDKVWKDASGNDYEADITVNYKGDSVKYGEFYFKKGNKYYKATIQKGEAPNSYIRNLTEIARDGKVIQVLEPELLTDINSNYKVWQMFGGMHSQEFNKGILQPSESSIQNTVKAIINTGKLKPSYQGGDITAEHLDQPLKNADIHYMPTIGAVKQGAANMNPNKYYGGKQDLNFFKIRMTNAGIQLDKEHHADGSSLSLMTQVISSACSMGYSPAQAKRLYKALYNLTRQGVKKFRDSFMKLLDPTNPNPEAFEETVALCIVQKLLTSTARDGDMLRAIASELIEKVRKGDKLTAEDAKTLPYSDPAVFEALVSNLSVIMTKSGIKAKMNGILSVLCPSQNIVKMFSFIDENGVRRNLTLSQLEEMYGDDYENIIDKIQDSQTTDVVTPDYDTTKIDIGKKYRITLNNGKTVVVDVKFPHNYRKVNGEQEVIGYKTLKNLIKQGNVVGIQEYIKDGKELGSIGYKFRGTDGKNYQIWDIDYIQELFEVMEKTKKMDNAADKLSVYLDLISRFDGGLDNFNEAKSKYFRLYKNQGAVGVEHQLKLAQAYARQLQQQILFALSKNNVDKIPPISIDGDIVIVNKDSIQVEAYELVMPKIFLEEFGLDNYANLDEIINNPQYFYDRMVRNFTTKALDHTHYDVELKQPNGKHIYLKDRSGVQPDWNRDLEKVVIYTDTDEQGNVWRIDLATNQKMYRLHSENDEVYRLPGTECEVILTSGTTIKQDGSDLSVDSGITFYLDNFKYQAVHISDAIAAGKNASISSNNRPLFDDVLNMIERSENPNAKAWVESFRDENGELRKDRVALNLELNNFKNVSPNLRKKLEKQAVAMHTSLIKSLDVIAARIPAQNQQSFMPMKVVAWDNPNINTAYVSVMQFFLQGSDLDIDAVSLLTFAFSESGEFYNWSPDFDMRNIDFLNLSMNLPFPSGDQVKIITYDEGDYVNTADRKELLPDNKHYQALKQLTEVIRNEADSVIKENLEKEALKEYIKLLQYVENSGGTVYFNSKSDLEDKFTKRIIKRIDKHNTYFKKVANDKIVTGAIKNYVVGSLHAISTDAANLLEAHTGVDVATGPIKDIANKSELSEVLKTATPGNAINKYQAIEEASVGKDDIAICATGLKGFFAATQFCNSYLNGELGNMLDVRADEIASIVKFNPVQIGGKTFNTLANIRVDDLEKVNPDSEIYQLLLDKGFDDDASVIMSALLSLSTDNAKELCLAKINAGTGMIPLYLYGAAIGMDFKVMNKIIASPLGFTVAKLLGSNEFTMRRGKTSVDSALTYLMEGPGRRDLEVYNGSLKKLSVLKVFEDGVKSVLSSDPELMKTLLTITGKEKLEVTRHNIGSILSLLTRTQGPEVAYSLLARVNEYVNNTIQVLQKDYAEEPSKYFNFLAMNNQLNDYLNEFVGQVSTLRNTKYVTEYGESDIAEDLNKLALGANEFTFLGKFLRLNQEIKTKSDELIAFVQRIETVITERAKIIINTNKRLGIKNPKGLKNLKNFDFKLFAESFLLDYDNPDAYFRTQIELYERYCKTCINPLRILTTVDHYRGYLESMIYAYEGDYIKSTKFRAIKHLGNKFIETAKVTNAAEKKSVFRGVQQFVDEYINNEYLGSQDFIQMPETSEKFPVSLIDIHGQIVPNKYKNSYIALGTPTGNRQFEHFFENTIIPALKMNKEFGNNMFVQGLKEVLVTDPITGIRYLAISLPINMLPTSDNERILFNKYKNDFNKIAGRNIEINGKSYSILQMFQYYNLLKFRGRGGRNSLTSIFEDVMGDEKLKSYRSFVNNFDKTFDFAIGGETRVDEATGKTIIGIAPEVLYKYLAPLTNPRSSSASIIKYKDPNTGKTVLLKLKKEEKDSDSIPMSEDMMDLMGDTESFSEDYAEGQVDYDYNEDEGMDLDGDDVEGVAIDYKPDYGKYEPYAGDGILTRFDPPTIPNENKKDRIFDYYNTGEFVVRNMVIADGEVKQFVYNDKTYDVPKGAGIIKILVQQDKSKTEVIDQDKLNSVIKTIMCGK